MLFLPRLRLRTRMMVFLGLFLLVLMLVVSVLGVQRDRDLLTQRMQEEGLALARAYALAAENALILKGAGLARVAGEAGQIPEITFLAISDPQGVILAHTEPSRIGEKVNDPLVDQALRTPIGAVEAGRTPVVTLGSPAAGREVLEVVMPLVILDQVRGVLQIGLGTDLIRQAELNTTRSSLLIALAAFLFGVAFIAAFSLSVTRPLTALAKAADQIRPGTWNVPVPLPGDGEVGQLAEALERMRQEVWASFVRLREQTAEVEQLKAYAEDILDSLQAGVVSLDLTGRLRGMNRSALALLGLDAPPRPRMTPSEVLAPWPPLLEAFEAVAAGEGEVREVILPSAGRPAAANRLLRLHAARLKDRSGTVIGELVVFDDITFLRSMEQRVRDAEKMAAMGELSAGVAHEVRNPLGSIRNAAQFLQQKLETDDPRSRFTTLIIGEVDRLNALVSRLLQYTRGGSGGLEVHDLRESVGQALLLAELRAPSSRVKLVRLPEGPVPPVWADPKRIVQLLLNLLFNAIEAIPDRGRVTVLLGSAEGRVWLRIADDGVGMAPEVLARLGEPFFTTRDEGTGLGLAIARQIVGEHRGSLRFESQPGQGTTVVLEFPVCEQENR